MLIKIKHIVIIMLAICVLGIIYLIISKPVNEFLTKRKYEKQIVNFLNFKSFDNVSDVSIKRYNYYKNYYNEPNIDISPLIESYIKQVETNEMNPYNSDGLSVEITSNMEREIQGWDYTYITALYYGKDRKLSIEDLEKVLVHTSKDKYSGWCIPKDSPGIIELPYNFYLKYEPSDFKLLDNVKRVTKCDLVNPITYGHYRKDIKLEIVDEKNNKKTLDRTAVIDKEDGDKLTISLSGIYYSQSHKAKIELCNHYEDKVKEEWQIVHADDIDDAYWEWDSEECKAIIDKFR